MSKMERIFSKSAATIETITPEKAAEYLALNTPHNRRIDQAHVNRWVAAMKERRWHLDGSPIRFDEDGKLLDGQHRLAACIKAGVPFMSYVIRGLKAENFAVIDTGRIRTASDALTITGIANATALAASTRLFAIAMKMKRRNEALENETCIRLVDRYPQLQEWTAYSKTTAFKHIVFAALVAGTGAAFEDKHGPEKAYEFWDAIRDGTRTGPKDPRWVLRERLTSENKSMRSVDRWYKLAITIKAWNSFLAGEQVTLYKWLETEDFPTIR